MVEPEEAEMSPRGVARRLPAGPAAPDQPSESSRTGPPISGRDAPAPTSARPPWLLTISRHAMACQFEVLFDAKRYPQGAEAAVAALDRVDALENELSWFRPTSRLSRLNQLAGHEPVPVEPWLFDLLKLAMQLHEETAGALDLTSAPLWEAWGFDRRAGAVPTEERLAQALAQVGSQYVQLDPDRKTVFFTKPGIRLNLGSMGKGYALDCGAEVLKAWGVADFLFHAGQSSVLAWGSQRADCPAPWVSSAEPGACESGWTVGVPDPLHPARRLAEIRLRNQALGTSGSTRQYFRHRGHRYSHILDPRTGRPAEGVLSVTVVAPTAALADGLSTAFFVMGPDAARTFCAARPALAALFVCPADRTGRVTIHSMGFEEDQLRLSPSR